MEKPSMANKEFVGDSKNKGSEPAEEDREPFDKVEEADEESFPASDPPAY